MMQCAWLVNALKEMGLFLKKYVANNIARSEQTVDNQDGEELGFVHTLVKAFQFWSSNIMMQKACRYVLWLVLPRILKHGSLTNNQLIYE